MQLAQGIGISIAASLIGAVAGDTLHVPADYATIQQAIDAAAEGDEVVLAPGTYLDSFAFKPEHVIVRSADGAGTTIIDGSGEPLDVSVYFPATCSGELRGLTVRNHEHSYAGAVEVKRCRSHIVDCIFESNTNYWSGAAVRVSTWSTGDFIDIQIRGCTFRENNSTEPGGALSIDLFTGDAIQVVDCLFQENSGDFAGHVSAHLYGQSTHAQFEGCQFISGVDQVGALIIRNSENSGGEASLSMQACLFAGNVGDALQIDGAIVAQVAGCTFSETAGTALRLLNAAQATVVDTVFCGTGGADIIGPWTDLGGNTFTDSCSCPGDGNGDGQVSADDLLGLLAAWGTGSDIWDWDSSGTVDVVDLLLLVAAWGPC